MASGRLIDYLGVDVIANRPAAPTLHADTLGLFYASDTGILSAWDGATWEDVGGTGDVAGPASAVDDRIATFDGTTGKLIQDGGVTIAQLAPLASPPLTGTPTAPTATPATNSTQIATTAYVDAAVTAGGSSRATASALATSGSVAINYALGDYFTLALAGNVSTFTFSNLPGSGKGATLMVRITQDSTPRTVGWPASFKWAGGVAGVVSTGSGAVDVLAITTFDNGTSWQATLAEAFA